MFSIRSDLTDNGSRPLVSVKVVQGTIWKRTMRPPFTLLSTTPQNPIVQQCRFRHHYCIPSDLADLRIKSPAVLLANLNYILDTNYSFHSTPALRDIMLDCISKDYDLGMVYGMLRCWWHDISPDYLSRSKLLENKDSERREGAVVGGLIRDVRIPPRRVWDLYSNRVLPFWAVNLSWGYQHMRMSRSLRGDIVAVSHAWMSPGQRIYKGTPINNYQWPVPIPQDIDLDSLRIELLNLYRRKMEYAWLDVLCLRQKGGLLEEQLLAKEWKIDVPTIGTIYEHCLSTVLYLNGLGRPFEENDLDDARHWCNRAWTVQEWCCGDREFPSNWHPILGGITELSPCANISTLYTGGYNDFTKRLGIRMNMSVASVDRTNIIEAAAMMSRRQAERDVDKLAGLAYLACGETQPVFDADKCVDDAWLPFIDCMSPEKRGQLFFLFPVTGDRDYKWAPSWNQLLGHVVGESVAKLPHDAMRDGYMDHEFCPTMSVNLGDGLSSRQHTLFALQGKHSKHSYSCLVVCLPNCHLDGFDSPDFTSVAAFGHKIRSGTVSFDVRRDCSMSFDLIACHAHPIPNGRYCLLAAGGYSLGPPRHWVVGLLDEEERFHKISVLEIEFCTQEVKCDVAGSVFDMTFAEVLSLPTDWHEDSHPWIRRVELA